MKQTSRILTLAAAAALACGSGFALAQGRRRRRNGRRRRRSGHRGRDGQRRRTRTDGTSAGTAAPAPQVPPARARAPARATRGRHRREQQRHDAFRNDGHDGHGLVDQRQKQWRHDQWIVQHGQRHEQRIVEHGQRHDQWLDRLVDDERRHDLGHRLDEFRHGLHRLGHGLDQLRHDGQQHGIERHDQRLEHERLLDVERHFVDDRPQLVASRARRPQLNGRDVGPRVWRRAVTPFGARRWSRT